MTHRYHLPIPHLSGSLELEYRCPRGIYFWVRNILVLIILDITYTLHLLATLTFHTKKKADILGSDSNSKSFPLQVCKQRHCLCALFGLSLHFQLLGPGIRRSVEPKCKFGEVLLICEGFNQIRYEEILNLK